MKKFLLQLTPLALLAFFACPATAQSAKQSLQGEVTWTRGERGDLAALRAELETRRKTPLNEAEQALVGELRAKIAAEETKQPWLISFDFPGGPLKNLLNTLSKANVISFNIIGAGDQTDLATELPPFALHNAPIGMIFEVVKNLLLPRGLTLAMAGQTDENSLVCVLTRHAPAVSKPAPPPTFFDSFPLGTLLVDHTVDDIVDAIRAGWELDPAHDKDALRLKFHPATSILLVSGPPEATMIAGKVLSQIKRPPPLPQKSESQPRPTPPPEPAKR